MPKEKSINPAQAQRKADKAKAIKKGKAETANRRTEKLARRNPERLQKQLDELKAIESSGGSLTSHEKSVLEGLEKDVKAVRKAREALGEGAPKFASGVSERGGFSGRGGDRGGRGGGRGGLLGKRRRDDDNGGEVGSSEEDMEGVDEETKRIPMPRDTPPPIAKEVLDRWHSRRRERLGISNQHNSSRGGRGSGTNANSTPLGENAREFPRSGDSGEGGKAGREREIEPAKTVYEAKPIVRDLRKEAVSFVPAAVRAKLDKSKGVGGLVEPEEADRLERAGYMGNGRSGEGSGDTSSVQRSSRTVEMEEVDDEDG